MTPACLSPLSEGQCALAVTVVPNARRTEAVGWHGDTLRLRLAAPPIDGRANDTLVAWLADELGLARRDIELRQGSTGRRKRLVLDCPAQRVAAWIQGLGLPPA